MISITFRRRLASAALGLALLGCQAIETTSPSSNQIPGPQFVISPWSSLEKQLQASLKTLTCSIEPISYAKAAIGPAGGTLRIGRHTLTVPAGALSTTVEISGLTVMDATASVHLYPSGLVFRTPATLRLDYGHCDKIKNTKFVVYTDDDALRILEVMPSADRPAKNFVEGKLDHFSRYAVAW